MEKNFDCSNDRFFFHPSMNDEEITDTLDKYLLQNNDIKDNDIVYLKKLPGQQLTSHVFDFFSILSLCQLYNTPMEIVLNALVVLIEQYGNIEENMFIVSQHLKDLLLQDTDTIT